MEDETRECEFTDAHGDVVVVTNFGDELWVECFHDQELVAAVFTRAHIYGLVALLQRWLDTGTLEEENGNGK